MLRHWLGQLRQRLAPLPRRQGRRSPRGQRPRRLWLEGLEDRILPSTVTWINPNGGDWDTPGNWSTGALPGTADDVVINNLNAGAAVAHAQNSTDSVASIAAAAPMTLSRGTLSVAGALGDTSTVSLLGGTLANASVQAGTILQANAFNGVQYSTLDGVTLNCTLNVDNEVPISVVHGLTDNGTINLSNASWLSFSSSQTVGGNGTIAFAASFGVLGLQADNITLTLGPQLTVRGNGRIYRASSGYSGANDTIINQGAILADTAGQGITIEGASLTNAASGVLQATGGGTLTIASTQFSNQATAPLQVTGSTLTITSGSWHNAGTIAASNAAVNLGGTFTLADLGTLNRSGGTINLIGALNNTATTFTLDATTGSWNLLGGTIQGGTVVTTGGAVLNALTANGYTGLAGTLDGVTLDGTLNVDNEVPVSVVHGLTDNGTINLRNFSWLSFGSSQTVGGNGTIAFAASFGVLGLQADNITLTLGPQLTVRGNGRIYRASSGYSGANDTIINQGAILADTAGQGITIEGASLTNAASGVLQATGGGTLTIASTQFSNQATAPLQVTGSTLTITSGSWHNAGTIAASNAAVNLGGTFTLADLGTFQRSGGIVNLTGTLGNTATTFTLDATTGSWNVLGGTIQGGTVVTTGGVALNALAANGYTGLAGTLDGVTLDGTLNVANGVPVSVVHGLTDNGTINLRNDSWLSFTSSQTVGGNGTIAFAASLGGLGAPADNVTVTLGPQLTVRGNGLLRNGAINGSGYNGVNVAFVNQGTILADTAGQGITIEGASFTNTASGVLQAASGTTLTITSGSWSNAGTISANNAAVNLGGAWHNAGTITANGSTESLGGTFAIADLGNFTYDPGTVNLTGTLNNAGTTLALSATTGAWNLIGGAIRGGTITTAGGAELLATGYGGTLDGVTLAGTLHIGQFLYPDAFADVINGLTLAGGTVFKEARGTLDFLGSQTLGGTGTVHFTDGNTVGGLIVPHRGDTLAITAGVTVHGNSGFVGGTTGGAVTNDGTITADEGGAITVQGATTFAASTLTGGTWQASNNSTLRILGANLSTDAATIVVDGSGSHLYSDTGTTNALAGLTAVASTGSLSLRNGANLTAATFTNAGIVAVGTGSTLTAANYTQTRGATALPGGALASPGTVNLQGGTLSGVGTVNGNLTNAAVVSPGSSPGILTIQGNYTQTAAAALNIEVGGGTPGSGYDQLNVSGTAALDGTLNVSLINGFGPRGGQVFDVVKFARSGGTFATVNLPSLGGAPAFVTQTTPTSFNLIGATTAPDLAVTGVTFTPSGGTAGQSLTVNYSVTNQGTVTAAGSWVDSVYLSSDGTLGSDALLLGRVTHSGDVAGLANYNGSLTAPLPGVLDGAYRVLVVADSQMVVPDIDRSNNVATAVAALPVRTNVLALGSPVSGTIANGQDLYYRVNVPPGSTVRLSADFAAALEAEFLVSFGGVPTRSSYDQSSTDLSDLHPQIVLPGGQGGPYYVLLHGREGAGAGQSFTLQAALASFEVDGIDASAAGNQGSVTMHVTGAGFTPQTVVTLRGSGQVVPAQPVIFLDASHLTATFDLTGLPVGSYTVQADDGGRSAQAPTPFQVTGQAPRGDVAVMIVSPATVRVGSPIGVHIHVTNLSPNDVQLPIFQVGGSNTVEGNQTTGGSILPPRPPQQLFGIGNPGETSFDVVFTPAPKVPNVVSGFGLGSTSPQTPLGWGSQQTETPQRPSTVPADAWHAIYANFLAAVGGTTTTLQQVLQADTTYFAQIGEPVTDMQQILEFEQQKANAEVPVPFLNSAVDSAFPETGLPLTFGRAFSQPIAGRYQVGILGRGWTSNWDVSALVNRVGNVFIHQGAVRREFVPRKDGSYQGTGTDRGTLTYSSSDFRLTEVDGAVTAFLPDGRLDYVQDQHGNRITAGYALYPLPLLTSLTASNGQQMLLSYNGQGRLSQVTDPADRVTTYFYDAVGEHLLSVTTPQGTTQYTYVTGQGIAQEHALGSISRPDGTHTFYTYDAQGRLIRQSGNSGAEALTYTYLSPGGYTVTDATGATTTVLVDDVGRPAVVRDALGKESRYHYDQAGRLLGVTYPGGTASSRGYDSQGNVSRQVDPLGNAVQYTYAPQFGGLQAFQNALGATTRYAYSGAGDLQTVTAPDGSTHQFGHNAQGRLTDTVNARGQAITYTYDSAGRLLRNDYPDGSHADYTYDAHGNMLTASDAGGTITMSYDGADRLRGITYPTGRSLTFGYDAGGRRTQVTDQGGFTENYGYDAAGRLSALADAGGALIVRYTYDAAGRLRREDHGNGTYTTHEYDLRGELLHLVNYAPDGSVNSRFDYTYDDLGRRNSVTTLDGTTTYGYDGADRLTSVMLPGGRTVTYQYDPAGNRTTVSDSGATTNYTTNNLDEYTAVGGSTYGYDADGNLTVRSGPGGSTTYTYDVESRLIGVRTPTDTWAYQYDALGNRVAVTHNGQTTRYLVDPTGLGEVVGEYDGSGNLVAHYTEGLGLVSRVDGSNASAYYDFDATGSTSGLSGAGGGYVDSYSYLPFGEVQSSNEAVPNPFQFAGQNGVMHEGNGLDLMRARFYTPSEGRFLNRDPIGVAGGTNLYQYTMNSPTNMVDPSGLDPIADLLLMTPGNLLNIDNVTQLLRLQLQLVGVEGIALQMGLSEAGTQTFLTLAAFLNEGALFNVARQFINVPAYTSPLAPIGGSGATAAGAEAAAGLGAGAFALAAFDVAIWAYAGYEYGKLQKELFKFVDENMPIVPATGNFHGSCSTEQVGPEDPNFLSGPAGVGAQNFLPVEAALPYAVYFENKPTASAPAQVVTVTQQLDPNLDWSTFQLGDFSFGNYTITVPSGRQDYSTRVDARGSLGVFVDVTAGLNLQTGLVTWTFTTIDPTTLDQPIGNVLEGFLPPDDASQRGEGWVSYTLQPKASDSTGTVINGKATVVFDTNAPIDTAPVFNTLDAGAPTSSVAALPAYSPGNFTVRWSGSDDAGGSSIASFNVYVSDNGGPFTLWQSATAQTSASYTGVDGHTYAFYSVATDNVGHQEIAPTTGQAVTTVDAVAPTSSVAALPATESSPTFTVSWSGSDNVGGSGLAFFDVYASDNGGPFTPWQTHSTQTSASFRGQPGHTYGFYGIATDNAGNVQPTPAAAQASTLVQYGTSTQLSSSTPNNTTTQGQPVTFTAAVSNAVSGGPTPTGKVDFVDTTTHTDLGTFALTNGQASVTTAALAAGQHVIVANYLADAAFINSSGSLTETVTAGGPVDITSQTSFGHNGGSFNRRTRYFVQSATLTNTGGTTWSGPVSLVLNLPANVVLAGALINGVFVAAKRTQDGRYYVDLLDAGSPFSPGQTLSFALEFNQYPGSYNDEVLVGPGQR